MKFWKKKEKTEEPEEKTPEQILAEELVAALMSFKVVSGKEVARRFIMDSRLAEGQQLSTLLGLPPLGEEEAAEEQAESDARTLRAAHLTPFVFYLSEIMGRTVVEYLRTMSSEQVMDDTEADRMSDLLVRVCAANTIGSLAQLEDLGFIKYVTEGAR